MGNPLSLSLSLLDEKCCMCHMQLQGSPRHGQLAPLSLGGSKPLPSVGGLPQLKVPPSLAPVRVPSGMVRRRYKLRERL